MGKILVGENKIEINVNLDNYVDLAGRTNNPDYKAVSVRMAEKVISQGVPVLLEKLIIDLDTHLDAIKKYLFYGKEIPMSSFNHISEMVSPKSNLNLSYFEYDDKMIDIFHGVIGQATEAGEMLKALLQFIESGDIDLVNLSEESGDAVWYHSLVMKRAGVTFDNILTTNIKKLATRFPDGFSEHKAINRDLTAERNDLEKNLNVIKEDKK